MRRVSIAMLSCLVVVSVGALASANSARLARTAEGAAIPPPPPALVADRVTLELSDGAQVVIQLDNVRAPFTSAAFVQNCRLGIFNGVPFTRFDRSILVGGWNTLDGSLLAPAQASFPRIFEGANGSSHVRGAIAVVGTNGPGGWVDSFPFAVYFESAPMYDGKLTVFGRVVEGLELLESLNAELADDDVSDSVFRVTSIE